MARTPNRWLGWAVLPVFVMASAGGSAAGIEPERNPEVNVIQDATAAPVLHEGHFYSESAFAADAPCVATERNSGDWLTRQTLLGDPCGLRAGMAESGVSVQLFDLTQVYQGVASGGSEQGGAYGGHSDLVLLFDASKMGGPKGLTLKIRGEGNFGNSITEAAGVLLPPAIQPEMPVADERTYAITNFLITQALSESFVVFAGKMDSLDGDANAFAHGRGKTQFMNSAFIVNPVGLRTIPYSTLAAGFSIVKGVEPIFTFAAWNPTDTSTTTGLSELYEEGVTLSAEARLPTNFFGKPGHQLVAATWASRDVVALDQDPRLLLPGVSPGLGGVARAAGSCSAYWNMDQYLVVDPADESRGWGWFARYGAADPDTSPLAHFASAGFGGSSLLRSRKADTWGVGYYYAWTSDRFLTRLLQFEDGQGLEAYYRAMLTPYFDITPDLQLLDGGRPIEAGGEEWAVILGARANLRF